jgi:NAD(P)-dependent dehydrogenase (short-subunit alcohol dehydrogenase family)
MELSGKVAVVTGGAVRLGRAISLALARAGANVAVHYGSSQQAAADTCREIESLGVKAVAVQADMRIPVAAAQAVFQRVQEVFGRAEILVNSAAIFEAGTLADTDEDHWERHFNINLKAPFFLCRSFAGQIGTAAGHIVNIADWRGTRPSTGYLVYTLTKVALVAMTKNLALELAPRVQVNAIAPGAILPPPNADKKYLKQLAERIPLRHIGSPDEVTAALLFLLRSDFITGEVVHITGGEQL